jgi:signal transduction histidine kinase
MRNSSKASILLIVFAVYIILQFLWWAYMLLNLNTDYYNLKNELYLAWAVVPDVSPEVELSRKRFMIFGEGFIFLTLLIVGITLSARFLKRDFALARLQRNFLLSVSHELKTPIASMQLYLQTLKSRNPDEATRSEMIDRALSDNHRLQKLVEKLLLATQLENSALDLYRQEIDVNRLIGNSLKTFALIDGGKHQIKFDGDAALIVNADEIALETIIMNLIENAVKYAPEGTTIDISTKQTATDVLIEVTNTGKIDSEEQKLIFTKFYRAGNEVTRTTKGTGIGLFLVKSLTDLHKGKVELFTKDNLVCFKVSLPN